MRRAQVYKGVQTPHISYCSRYKHSQSPPPQSLRHHLSLEWSMYPAAPLLPWWARTLIYIHIHTPVSDNPWSLTYIVCPPTSDLTIHHHMAQVPHWEGGWVVLWGKEREKWRQRGERARYATYCRTVCPYTSRTMGPWTLLLLSETCSRKKQQGGQIESLVVNLDKINL